MDGGPSPNAYQLPTTIGFPHHSLIKCRNPAVMIGQELKVKTTNSQGMLYNIRDHTRFGKAHQPKYNFSKQMTKVQECLPAPNRYYPEKAIGFVKPKYPQISLKSRTNIGKIAQESPAPNMYILPSAIQVKQANIITEPTKPRVLSKHDQGPAPNRYLLPPTNNYKYKNTMKVKMWPKTEQKTNTDGQPAPNLYNVSGDLNQETRGKTFGKKIGEKRIIYLTTEDLK
ncbi:outer dense fiber protein 3-like protein 2 [Adelges cooleyi]|uniref:outer dense fiber protein 3-like protein 2 n=1 Tax=Adelges cooleyi TaxID=133065 RepID=UPI00217F898B|nr:outer dense fiber protein 3-like protein 2 [Adelges cooleyi]